MNRMKMHQDNPYLLERMDIRRKLAEESITGRDFTGILATDANMSKTIDNTIPVVT